ncbi:cytochrome C oxidase subunit IV family protein [Ruegeria atlantica]|uniref:Nitric oxide reductase F protein n=1 Tax=Ruegeria atlantica TaxID=81569 RepID=A0A0P1E8V3_9RHOB|nr:cytochrome C oxidase subunit IV family protein [Ruegeria atlantica]CUH44963.1 hypothetical protein RUM4293_03872 [Ruegeria atlantica]
MPSASSFPNSSRRRHSNLLTQAWFALLALSLASTLLTMLPVHSALVVGGILILALIKARVILARYLDLAESPTWLRGFTFVMIAFACLVLALYLI